MTYLKRRQLLQFSGSALAAIASHRLLSASSLARQGQQYSRLLAQNTRRKLALLVGINGYKQPVSPLRGCLTDVEMQFELLTRRYGFHSRDIVIVSDEGELAPNRAGILQAFEEHLIGQAKPGDVVVFHFSGHGSQALDPNPIPGYRGVNGTMVPLDGRTTAESSVVEDIMGRTLFLLTYALDTENVTVVLDSCHSGGGTRGNLVFRATSSRFGGGAEAKPSETELEYQQQMLARTGIAEEEFETLRQRGIAKGVAIGSARANQLAADAPFGDFYAGAFSYLLTRYLWQQPASESLGNVFVSLARSTRDIARSSYVEQDPIFAVQPDSDHALKPLYFLETQTPAAEGVVRNIDGDLVEFWSGGISSANLESVGIFEAIDESGATVGELEQLDRRGLIGYGKVRQGQVQVGNLLREKVRGIPARLNLRVGLDRSLGASLGAARAGIEGVSRVEAIALDREETVDYILAKADAELRNQVRARGILPPPMGSIGLTTAGLTPVPDTFGNADEPIENAIARLRPRLRMLLAGRILGSILNRETSDLRVNINVEPVGDRGSSGAIASRGSQEATNVVSEVVQELIFPAGTEVQVRIANGEDIGLYIAVLAILSNGNIVVLHPVDWDSPEAAALVEAGQVFVVPNRENYQFVVQGPAGFFELLVLASTDPLRDALRGLQRIAGTRGASSGNPLGLGADEPVEVMEALLGDLDRNTRGSGGSADLVSQYVEVDRNQLAAISAIIEVVE